MIPRLNRAMPAAPAAAEPAGVQRAATSAFLGRLQAHRAPSSPVSGSEVVRAAVQGARPLEAELVQGEMFNLLALSLQFQIASGKTSFVSNLLKARHDTAKNMIQNVR